VLIVPALRLVACTGVGRISTSILLNIHAPCKVLGTLRTTTALMRGFYVVQFNGFMSLIR